MDPGDVSSLKDGMVELIAKHGRVAFVARSNASVFVHAIRADTAGLTLEWVGGVKGYRLGFLKDLCRLALADKNPQERNSIEGARVKAFKSFGAARAFAKRVDDREMLARTDIVTSYGAVPLLAILERLELAAEKREKSAQPPPAD